MSQHIIQLSRQPVTRSLRATRADVGNSWFCDCIADRVIDVSGSVALKTVFDELSERLDGLVTVCNDGYSPCFRLKSAAKEAWFDSRYDIFRREAGNLAATAARDGFMSGNLAAALYDLQRLYDNEHDLYVYDDNGALNTFDHFIRRAAPFQRYYVGSIFEYGA